MLKDFDSEAKTLKTELLRTVWYMRGGISIDQAYMLSVRDLELISTIVKENIDNSKKSGMPLI